MRYEDMPKGRNKDRCVRCGKRYNFADKALSKAKVPYDLLCLAEVTTSGYMTHGNVKLCDECMAELLMWLDRKTENSSEKPNNSTISKMEQVDKDINVRSKDEPQTEEMVSCQTCKHWIPYECTNDKCHYEPKAEELYDQIVEDINTRVKCAFAKKIEDEPQTEEFEEPNYYDPSAWK